MYPIPNLPPLDVPGILRQFNLQPDKRLGQNFLIDPAGLKRVVEAAEVTPEEAVLEIGAGLGSLTRYLALIAKQVVAVELDEDLIAPLEIVLSPYTNVKLVKGDILRLDPAGLVPGPPHSAYLVVANIPYYITSALIRHLLEEPQRPSRLALTVQREVAERITAKPGEMSLLALSVQVYGKPRIAARIPAGAFYPVPKVDSAVMRVDLFPSPRIPETSLDDFFRLAKAGFSQKRKTLRNALSAGMRWTPSQAEEILSSAGIHSMRRAETLSLEEWGKLVDSARAAGINDPV
jgi:16S rRNA (adenine1518-N6/adenine1519-N6)-dimethyltransferase